jgi:hypothetical protein
LPPIIKKILVRGFLGLIGAAVVIYVLDAIQIRVRLSLGGSQKAYDTVTVLYESPMKGNKLEIYADSPETQTCARSLFPQMGYSPCWYVRSHAVQMLD